MCVHSAAALATRSAEVAFFHSTAHVLRSFVPGSALGLRLLCRPLVLTSRDVRLGKRQARDRDEKEPQASPHLMHTTSLFLMTSPSMYLTRFSDSPTA